MDVTTRNNGKLLEHSSFGLKANIAKDHIANNRLDELFSVINKCIFVLNAYKRSTQDKLNAINAESRHEKRKEPQFLGKDGTFSGAILSFKLRECKNSNSIC